MSLAPCLVICSTIDNTHRDRTCLVVDGSVAVVAAVPLLSSRQFKWSEISRLLLTLQIISLQCGRMH